VFIDLNGQISLQSIDFAIFKIKSALGLTSPLTSPFFESDCPNLGFDAFRTIGGVGTGAFGFALADSLAAGGTVAGGPTLPLVASGVAGFEIGSGVNGIVEATTGVSISDRITAAASRGDIPFVPGIPGFENDVALPKEHCCGDECCNE